MRIEFQQSGGVAGILRKPVVIDTNILPPESVEKWQRLVADADFFNLPPLTCRGAARDAFCYRLSIEEGDRRHTVEVDDRSTPSSIRALIDEALRASKIP